MAPSVLLDDRNMSPDRRPRGRPRFAAGAALLAASLWTLFRPIAAGHSCTYGQPTLSSAILYERLAFDVELGVVSCRGNVAAVGTVLSDIVELPAAVPTRDALFPQESQQGGLNGLLFVNGLMNGIGARDFAVSAWIWPHIGPGEDRAYLIDAYGPGGFNDLRFTMGVGFGVLEAAVWTGSSLQGGNSGQAVEVAGVSTVPKWIHVAVTRTGTELSFYINGRDTGTGAEVQAVGDFSDIANITIGTQRIGVASANRWLGQVDDIRVYVGTVSASEIYGIFRASHSAYNAVQQVGFSSFSVAYPAQPGGDTQMYLGFNATYDNTYYMLMPSMGTFTGAPATVDQVVTGPLRGFGISMLAQLDFWRPDAAIATGGSAWVFTTGDLPSRIRVLRPDFTLDGNTQAPVCDFFLVEAPNGMIQQEVTQTFLAQDQAVALPQFERVGAVVHPVRPELGRGLLPQITSYVMAPRTTYAVATAFCNVFQIPSYVEAAGIGSILVTESGFAAPLSLVRTGIGEPWYSYGTGIYLLFDIEVEAPGFQGVDNAVDGAALVPDGGYLMNAEAAVAASFTVGASNLRLDGFTIRFYGPALPEWFSCTVELHLVDTTLSPPLPTGPALATGSILASGHSTSRTSLSFMAPEAVSAVTLRRGKRYSLKVGPCDMDVSWGHAAAVPFRRRRRQGPTTTSDVSLDPWFLYLVGTAEWIAAPAYDLLWSMDVSKEPTSVESVTGRLVVTLPPNQCGTSGTYGVAFTPSCDLPCPQLPAFQVDAGVAEPDGWCRDNRTAAPFGVGPHTVTVTEVPGPAIRYPGDWALWYLRVVTDGTHMKRVVVRNATLELPDRPEGSPWRSRVLWLPSGAMPLGTAVGFPDGLPGTEGVLYRFPTDCAAGTANDTGADCARFGVRMSMGNSEDSYLLEEGVDTGTTRVGLVVNVDVEYFTNAPSPGRKRSEGGGRTASLELRAETTVRMGKSVAGRKLRVHGSW